MEQYKGQHDGQQDSQQDGIQPAREHIGNFPVALGDRQAPVTLLPTVLSRLGLSNGHTGVGGMNDAPTDLHSSDWQVRLAAVRTLGKMGTQAPLEPLLVALKDEDASVRAAAVRGLSALGERVPVERLLETLHDPDWHVRETTILLLGRLLSEQPSPGQSQGSPLHRIPPTVFDEVLHDADSTVREAAQLALQWSQQRRVLNPAQTTPSSPPSPLSPPSTPIPSQNTVFPSSKNMNEKQRQRGYAPGETTMQEQRESRQQPSMQEPEYEYYAYQENDRARQWEKVTSYTPRKNYRPFWIGGIAGGIIFLIVAASGLLWTYNANITPINKFDFAKPTMMLPTPMPTPPYSNQTLFTYQGHQATVNSVSWSPDGKRIASASDDNTVQVWDALTGKNPLKFGGHTSPVNTVAWSPDGTRIASGSIDGTIEVWNPVNGSIYLTYHFAAVADTQHIGALQALSGGGNPGVYSLAWSPDSSRIAAAMGSNIVQEFDAHTGTTLFTYRGFVGSYYSHPSKINAMAWSPDGRYIITAGDAYPTTIWDASNGQTVFTYPSHDNDRVFALAWSPDGKRVALGNVDGSARIWTPATNDILVLNGHSQNIYALAWSPDGTRLATASIDDTVQILNTTTGEEIYVYTGHTNELRTIAWSPSGKLIASGSSDDTVQVWVIP